MCDRRYAVAVAANPPQYKYQQTLGQILLRVNMPTLRIQGPELKSSKIVVLLHLKLTFMKKNHFFPNRI